MRDSGDYLNCAARPGAFDKGRKKVAVAESGDRAGLKQQALIFDQGVARASCQMGVIESTRKGAVVSIDGELYVGGIGGIHFDDTAGGDRERLRTGGGEIALKESDRAAAAGEWRDGFVIEKALSEDTGLESGGVIVAFGRRFLPNQITGYRL